MHNYQSNGFGFNYNSDMSGDVFITNLNTGETFTTNGEAILDFVSNHIRNEKIAKLENMDNKQLLKEVIDK